MADARVETLLPVPRGAGPVTHFRSTWLASSLAALRARGYFERYVEELPREVRDTILTHVAGVWLPVDVAMTHYAACERLRLTTAEQVALGRAVEDVARRTTLQLVVRVAREAGVTPWAAFAHQQTMWSRAWRGGGVGVRRVGPKEALLDVVGWPCARFTYVRNATKGIVLAQTGILARSVYVNEVPTGREDAIQYRVAWA